VAGDVALLAIATNQIAALLEGLACKQHPVRV
jgi:hypothetical protein